MVGVVVGAVIEIESELLVEGGIAVGMDGIVLACDGMTDAIAGAEDAGWVGVGTGRVIVVVEAISGLLPEVAGRVAEPLN